MSEPLVAAPESPAPPATATATGKPTVAANMAMTALGNAVTPIAALISMPILTYTLGVTGRGEIAAASGPLLLATTAATFGIPEAVAYVVARSPALLRSAARRGALLIMLAGLLATGVCFAAAGLLANGDPGLATLIMIASLALVPTMLVLILRACAAGLQRWRMVAFEQTITAVVRLVGVAGFALAGHLTPLTATVIIAVSPVIGGLAYLPLRGHRQELLTTGQHTTPVAARQLVSYGSRIWLGSLSGILLARLDQTIMTPLSGTYQLGLYAVAVSVSDVALILHSAVRDVTFTSDAAEQDDDRLCASARISGTLSFGFSLVLAAGLPLGLPLLFGQAFAPAIPAAFWLLAAVVLVTPGSIAGAGLSARGRPGLRSLSLFVACGVNVVALVLLLPVYGAVGAAVATFIGNVISSQLNILWMRRISGIPTRKFYGLRRSDLAIIFGKVAGVLTRLRRALPGPPRPIDRGRHR